MRRRSFQNGDRLIEATEIAQGRSVLDGEPRMPGPVETEFECALILCPSFSLESHGDLGRGHIAAKLNTVEAVNMIAVVQVNLVVGSLERSRVFYERLGIEFRPRNRHGDGPAEAWVSTNAGITIVLHSTDFASWWDGTAPQPSAGGPQVDLELESVEHLDGTVADLEIAGAMIVKLPTDMPWGQRFAIVCDPDGHRVGLKAPRN